MNNLSVTTTCPSKSANSSPTCRRKLFRRIPKTTSNTSMKSYVNEALSETELVEEEEKRILLPELVVSSMKANMDIGTSSTKVENGLAYDNLAYKIDEMLDDFEAICKETLDQLKNLKNTVKKARDQIRIQEGLFEDKIFKQNQLGCPNAANGKPMQNQRLDNLYYNYAIWKTALIPTALSLKCVSREANAVIEPLQSLNNIPWLNVSFSKKQPMSKEKALPLIQMIADEIRQAGFQSDVRNATIRLNQSISLILCNVDHSPTMDKNTCTIVIWGRSGMAWHTHGFPNTRLKCEFHGWTVFVSKSSMNRPVIIADPNVFLRLLDGILQNAVISFGKETLSGPLPNAVCKSLENVIGGSWNCAVGKAGSQHAVSISDIQVADGLVVVEQSGLEFMVWQN